MNFSMCIAKVQSHAEIDAMHQLHNRPASRNGAWHQYPVVYGKLFIGPWPDLNYSGRPRSS
eukprot:scaffold3055_cov24-Prasinocladus_malaysianus.AAC.1